jgi:hypothetical protein
VLPRLRHQFLTRYRHEQSLRGRSESFVAERIRALEKCCRAHQAGLSPSPGVDDFAYATKG